MFAVGSNLRKAMQSRALEQTALGSRPPPGAENPFLVKPRSTDPLAAALSFLDGDEQTRLSHIKILPSHIIHSVITPRASSFKREAGEWQKI